MPAWLSSIWSTQDYLPHGLCLAWEPGLIMLHIVSDILIALSYYSIPTAIAYFASKRRDLPFQPVFVLFVLFILACGTTHVLSAVTLWDPVYRLDGFVKALTALVSVPTAVTLWFLMPAALALPSTKQLEAANESLLREIAERKKMELQILELNAALDQRVQARTAELQSILDTVPDAMIVVDCGGHIESFSVAAERMFHYKADEVRGNSISMIIPELLEESDEDVPEDLDSVVNLSKSMERVATARRRDGTNFPMELAIGNVKPGSDDRFTCFVHDLTERQEAERRTRELQAELAHVSRVTEMGQVASSIAHELNQPLTAAANYLAAQRRVLDSAEGAMLEGAKSAGDRAVAQVMRASEIVRRLRDFIKKSEPERKPENVVSLIEEASSLAMIANRKHDFTIDYRTASDLPPVLVDKVQIQQVMVNIMRNAVEAMEASPRREITLEAAPADEGLVLIAVSDTGSGISQDVAKRLFQPFVTTKAQGMGVGLSLCRSIIEAHGGRLWAEANPRGGTIFRFTVPAAV